jgi:hypothetical protein
MIRDEISPHGLAISPFRTLIALAHLADTQMVDEESPAMSIGTASSPTDALGRS